MARRIRLPAVSMQQKTALFQLRDETTAAITNDYAWGSWEPIDFEEDNSDDTFKVKEVHLGRLDLVSYEVYNTPDLWWVIAHVNDILNQFTDDEDAGGMWAGQLLRIPQRDRVIAVLSRRQATATTSEEVTTRSLSSALQDNPLGL